MDAPLVGAPEHNAAPADDRPPAFLLAQPPAPETPETSETAAVENPVENPVENSADTPADAPPAHIFTLLETAEPAETPENLPLVVEALLLAAEEPPTISQLATATGVAADAIEAALETLDDQAKHRGVRIQRHGATVRLVTAPEAAHWVERLLGLERPNRLSKAALETLAIIAYRQPITRSEIEAVRGVSCDAPLVTLRNRELIQPTGHAEGPGRPNLWTITPRFLEHFGLGALKDLPPLPDLPAASRQGMLELSEAPDADPSDTDATAEPASDAPAAEIASDVTPKAEPVEIGQEAASYRGALASGD